MDVTHFAVWNRKRQSVWRGSLAALLLSILWLVYGYRDTAVVMATTWYRSETFTHGFIVLPIALWLIWRQKSVLMGLVPKPSHWVFPLIVITGFGWLLGDLAAVNVITQFAFVALLVLCVPALLGTTVARAIAFPLGFMFFAVPIGEFALPMLMEWTAKFTVIALRLTGIPVYQEGLQFVIPSGSWSVVEACSGVRYLIASLCVGTLFAYLNYVSLRRRLMFVAVSIVVPIVANWLRAYMIVMIGHLSDGKLAAGVDHLIYGWVFFGIVMIIMFVIGARWAEDPACGPVSAAASADPEIAAPALRQISVAAVLVALIVTAPHVAKAWITGSDAAGSPTLVEPSIADWQITAPFADWRPAFENPSAELRRTYEHDGKQVGLYIGYFRNQNYGRKLVSSTNVLVTTTDKEWATVASGRRTAAFGGDAVDFRRAELRGMNRRLVAWQTYWVDGRLTSSAYKAKLFTALSRLSGRGDDSAVIILYVPVGDANADEVLRGFAGDAATAILGALNHSRDRR